MEIVTIDLFGKPVFSMVTMKELVQMPTPMPSDEAGFVYVLSGGCVNHSEIEEISLMENQAVLAKSGNSIFRTLDLEGNTEYKAISIRFHREIIEKIYQGEVSPFANKKNVPLTANSVKVESNEFLSQYIRSLVQYFNQIDTIPQELLILKLKELILLLKADKAAGVMEIMSNLFERKTFEFKEIIEAHIFSSISIEELAQLTFHSLSSFKNQFKLIYNQTPGKYIMERRIDEAAKLLLKSNENISNIAYDCGFKTLAHMSRVFKAKIGLSPSEYRKNFSDK